MSLELDNAPSKNTEFKKNMAIENPSRRQLLRGQFLQSLHSESAKIQGINAIRPPWSINEAEGALSSSNDKIVTT